MEKIDVSKLSADELEALLAQKRSEEKEEKKRKRAAYEGIRADMVCKVENAVRRVAMDVKELFNYVVSETEALKEIMDEYGQLKRENQMSYSLQEGNFKIEVKSNKVKKFDERADLAATRLIEYLQNWIKKSEKGSDDPVYQLAMTMLERNKYGDLDYKSISKLYELEEDFNDPEYSAIMTLFRESHLVEGTATNFYFWEKNNMGVWCKVEPSFNRL
jgi:hypothetical protein